MSYRRNDDGGGRGPDRRGGHDRDGGGGYDDGPRGGGPSRYSYNRGGDSGYGERERAGGYGGGRGGGGYGGGRGARMTREQEETAKDAAPREQGVVRSLKDKFGFVSSVDAERDDLFFHYSEVRGDVDSLRLGTELEFGVLEGHRPGDKVMAVRVVILPKGTVKTEDVLEADVEGEIIRELREPRAFDRQRQGTHAYGGRVRQLARQEGAAPVAEGAKDAGDDGGAEGAANAPAPGRGAPRGKAGRELGYSKDDLDVSGGAWKPGVGDTVLFDVARIRATKQLVARRVRFVKAAPKPEVPKETGVVATVKDGNYGFIKCCDRDERLFFHLSAVVDRAQAQALREGSEVRFAIEADREGRSVAAQLEVLPKGSVSFFEVLVESARGTVERALRQPAAKGFQQRDRDQVGRDAFGGSVAWVGPEAGPRDKPTKLLFDGEDVADPRGPVPQAGDTVEFQLVLDKPKKTKRARAVRVVAFGGQREQGIVCKVKEGNPYAFIRCCDREEPLFFHFSAFKELVPAPRAVRGAGEGAGEGVGEVADDAPSEGAGTAAEGTAPGTTHKDGALRNDDEVEFSVQEVTQDGRPQAARIARLPRGTVTFETELPGRFVGTVERPLGAAAAAPGGGKRDGAQRGLIRPEVPLLPDKKADKAKAGAGDDEDDEDGEGGAQQKPAEQRAIAHTERGGWGRGDRPRHDPEAGLVSFTAAELADPAAAFRRGDTLEFGAVLDRPTRRLRATRVALKTAALAEGEAPGPVSGAPERGLVVAMKHAQQHGFIQCADRDAPRLYFATADVDAAALREAAGREADGADDGGKGEQQAGEEAAAGEALEGDEGPAEKAADAGKDEKPGKQSRRIKVGDEVEFVVVEEAGRRTMRAVGVAVLPKGSVSFEMVAEARSRAVVSDLKLGKDGLPTAGSVRHVLSAPAANPAAGGSTEEEAAATAQEAVTHVPFSSADLAEPRQLVAKGQSVEYALATNKATGELRARDVTVLPTDGVVERLLETHGYVKCEEPRPARMDREIRFELSDVEKGDQGKLQPGSDVQFTLFLKSGGRDACAINVRRVHREGKAAKEAMPERLRRQQDVSKVVLRLAAGPDGTRGFVGAGRGKGLAPPAGGAPSLNVQAGVFTPGRTAPPSDPASFADVAE